MASMGMVLVRKYGIRRESVPCPRKVEEVAKKRSLPGIKCYSALPFPDDSSIRLPPVKYRRS